MVALESEQLSAETMNNVDFKDKILLPGSLHTQGYGAKPTIKTKWLSGELSPMWHQQPMYEKYRSDDNFKIFDFLLPSRHYTSRAWYTKHLTLPRSIENRRLILFLERVHWQSVLYVNGKKVGSNLGLGTSHEYDITDYAVAGENRITLAIDNSLVVDVGRIPHSLSEQTMTAWNGVLGEMYVATTANVWFDDVQIFPNVDSGRVDVVAVIGNTNSKKGDEKIRIEIESCDNFGKKIVEYRKIELIDTVGFSIDMGDKFALWDEFSPSLYNIKLSMKNDEWSHNFGMRKIEVRGRRLIVNDKELFVRGNLMCGEAPIDGLPEMGYQWWYNVLKTQKDWGFNVVRFHSWSPPKAAFEAADKVGIYLQAEASEWASVRNAEQRAFIDGEVDRMIHQYGNHPSFIFIAMGNELSCDTVIMQDFVEKLKKDNRRWVSGKINGAPVLDSFDYYSSRAVNRNDKFPARAHIGWPPSPKTNSILSTRPSTSKDYSVSVQASNRPFISHEIGQYCVFPNYKKELPKYVGSMRATVLEIERDQVQERAMEDDVERFSSATGLWQNELYKFEFESIMRSREIAGFHLLSFQDFPGQSHAPVGVFDSFWESKGHIEKDGFRKFCAPVVILARINNQILTTADTIQVEFEIYNYSSDDITESKFTYEVKNSVGNTVLSGEFCGGNIARGGVNTVIGGFKKEIEGFKPSEKYTIHAKLNEKIVNSWSFWVFNAYEDVALHNILVVNELDAKAQEVLNSGGDVLLLPRKDSLKGELPQSFGSIYWTSFGLNEGETMCNSILCDPTHPLFEEFPTESHTNWQWWDILINTRPMILDEYGSKIAFPKGYKPLVQAIDSWKINRKLAIIAECRVGKGRLMICSIDFSHSMESRPASRSLYRSIIEYMCGDKFNPTWQLSLDVVNSIFHNGSNTIKSNSEGGVLPTEG